MTRWIAVGVALAILVGIRSADAGGRAVTLLSLDGTPLAGELFEASARPAPGVVLIHMLSRSRSDWGNLGARLQDAGLTTLALDLRGHGHSSGSAQNLGDMVQDVRAAVQWLAARQGVRPGSTALVGASLGASLALLAAVDLPQVRSIALLSPSLDYRGLRTDVSLIKRIGNRPIWMSAGTKDPLALRTLRDFAAEPSGVREQRLTEGAAHGTQLLALDADLGRALVDWLHRSLLS